MSENKQQATFAAIVAIICFAALTDILFPFTIMLVKAILFTIGLICAFAFLGCISHSINRSDNKEIHEKNETFFTLILQSGIKSSIVNLLTVYRIIICPVLLLLLFNDSSAFKWLLLSAFITDALDGFLAKRFKVVSKLGAKLDSFADDILFIVCMISLLSLYTEMITNNLFVISLTFVMFFIKMALLYYRHKKIISGMHTYFVKAAAFLQALFFIDCAFWGADTVLFYIAAISTIIAIAEEIVIISIHKELKQDVKGLLFNNK